MLRWRRSSTLPRRVCRFALAAKTCAPWRSACSFNMPGMEVCDYRSGCNRGAGESRSPRAGRTWQKPVLRKAGCNRIAGASRDGRSPSSEHRRSARSGRLCIRLQDRSYRRKESRSRSVQDFARQTNCALSMHLLVARGRCGLEYME